MKTTPRGKQRQIRAKNNKGGARQVENLSLIYKDLRVNILISGGWIQKAWPPSDFVIGAKRLETFLVGIWCVFCNVFV